MPMVMLKLRPGVNVELTPTQLEAGYATSNLIRFRSGLAEKLGGWQKYFPFAVSGVPKCLHSWLDLNETEYLGVGSTDILATITDGDLTDITPQTYTSNFNEDFSTTNGSPNVTVTDSNISNVTTFDSVEFKTPISVGGIILSGVYPIDLVLSPTSYRVVAATNATSTVANGGAVPTFTTTSGSQTVAVGLASHGLSVGDTINFPISTTVGGVDIEGTYAATTINSSSSFAIAVATLATSSAGPTSMNSGLARIVYYIALGPAAAGTGYSIGGYSSGGYSTGTSGSAQTGTPITATDWTLDNWGQTFIACPEGGGIYVWTPNTGFTNAKLVSGNDAPLFNTGVFVSMQTQMLICYGSTDQQTIGIDQDPLLVKWSAQGDYTDFTISTTTQAGSRRLPQGSKIVGGLSVPGQEFLWTDLDLWSMNYLGSLGAGVWGFTKIGSNCGLIGKHAAVRQGSDVYWMGFNKFWVTGSGQPKEIVCPVWDKVFQDLNTTYQHKCFAWSNSPFAEVWYFYPRASTSATEPDAFVKYNVREGTWDYGPLDRTCGIDQSILGMPISATNGGRIYEHETSQDADGQPINAYFETGYFQLSEGRDISFVNWVLPDMRFQTASGASTSATLTITFTSKYYLGGATQTHGPYTYTSTTEYLNPRIRGRYVSMKIESNDLGSFWRLGGMEFRIAADGML